MAALTLHRAASARLLLPLILAGIAFLAAMLGGFVVVAPNRLLSGEPLSLWAAIGPAGALVGLAPFALAALLAFARARAVLIGLAGGAAMLVACALAGHAATLLGASAGPLTRVSLGPAFWCLLATGFFILADAVERSPTLPGKVIPVLATLGLFTALLASGALSELSLAREFAVRQSTYLRELSNHITLTGSGLALALLFGGMVGIFAYSNPRRAGPAMATLTMVQTIPSLALFALMIGPLTALTALVPGLRSFGVSGIGTFPAILALALYGMLPVARGVEAGLSNVPGAIVEAARGMGMTRSQIFLRTLVPLASPTLFQTFRVTLVQLIGLATLAALIGAGGLGTFIFQGLGQTAADLVLLGALSAIGLALFCDIVLRGLALLLFRKRAT